MILNTKYTGCRDTDFNVHAAQVAEAAIAQGFPPDTISSDLHSQVDHAAIQATPAGGAVIRRTHLHWTCSKIHAIIAVIEHVQINIST